MAIFFVTVLGWFGGRGYRRKCLRVNKTLYGFFQAAMDRPLLKLLVSNVVGIGLEHYVSGPLTLRLLVDVNLV